MPAPNPDPTNDILERLKALAETVAGEGHAYRNTLDVPDKVRPAIVILDADEEAEDMNFGRNRPAVAPLVIGMTPEIYLITSDSSDDVGAALRTLKKAFIKAVLHDTTLLALCHNGEIRYEGFATALANGRGMNGQARLLMRFMYVLRPDGL